MPSVEAIALAAVDDLAERLGPESRLAVLGWSFGAAYATLLPAERDRLVASVVYYGVYTGPHIDQSSAAVLGHFAETDQFESDEGIAELEDTVRAAGREVTIHRYPGTGHWFAEPSRDAYRPKLPTSPSTERWISSANTWDRAKPPTERRGQGDGGPICRWRSISGCWLTWMNPSRGRSRSTTSVSTAPRATIKTIAFRKPRRLVRPAL